MFFAQKEKAFPGILKVVKSYLPDDELTTREVEVFEVN